MLVTPSVFRSNTNELELEELPVIVKSCYVLSFYNKTTGRFFAKCQDDGKNGLRLV
jgi:hypothetical protein